MIAILLYLPWFLISIFFAFFIPGSFVLKRFSLSSFQRIVLSFAVGMVLWGLQGFLFGFIGLRWLTYLYLLISVIVWFKNNFKASRKFHIHPVRLKNFDILAAVMIVIGVLLHVSILLYMGILLPNGLYFCCGALGDFLYHLNLTEAAIRQIPPYEPDMYGAYVHNYHYLGNVVVADLVRVFKLPLIFTQFQYMGSFISLLFGLQVLIFAQINNLSRAFSRWLLFFLYFGGDFIYVLVLLLGRGFNLTMGPLENGSYLLNNPPRAFAIIVFFTLLCLFSLWIKKKNFYSGIIMGIVAGSLIGFKVYVGLFALSGFFTLGFYYLIRRKIQNILLLLPAFIFSLLIYLPVNSGSGGLHFVGFWRAQDFIVQPVLGLSHLELAREIYLMHKNWSRVFLYNILFLLIFNFSIFGPKLLGIFQTKKSLLFLSKEIHIFLIAGILASYIAGSFFWQQSGGSNSFNFLVSVYIIGSIYTALACFYWLSKVPKTIELLFIICMVLLSLPRIIYDQKNNFNLILASNTYFISNEDLKAMEFLEKYTSTNDLILVPPNNNYYTFLAKRNIFLGSTGLLRSHDVDTSYQKQVEKTILEYKDPQAVQEALHRYKIRYLYLASSEAVISTRSSGFLQPVFKNEAALILKVL